MAPPLIFLAFVILVVAIVGIGMVVALRTGLWVRETDPDAKPVPSDDRSAGTRQFADEDAPDRPTHVAVEDPANQRFVSD